MDCTCPRCASDQTQRLAIIYSDGALRTKNRSMQTATSSSAAPPKPMSYAGPIVTIFVTFLVIAAIGISKLPANSWLAKSAIGNLLQAAFLFLPVVAWVVLAYRYNHTTWHRLLKSWERSFQCHRCGRVFVPKTS